MFVHPPGYDDALAEDATVTLSRDSKTLDRPSGHATTIL